MTPLTGEFTTGYPRQNCHSHPVPTRQRSSFHGLLKDSLHWSTRSTHGHVNTYITIIYIHNFGKIYQLYPQFCFKNRRVPQQIFRGMLWWNTWNGAHLQEARRPASSFAQTALRWAGHWSPWMDQLKLGGNNGWLMVKKWVIPTNMEDFAFKIKGMSCQ